MEEKKMQPNSEKTHQMEENPLQRWFVRKPRMNLRAVPPTGESPSELSEGDVSLNLETSYSVPSHRCYVCTHCDSMDPTSTTIEGGCTECVVDLRGPGVSDRICSHTMSSFCRQNFLARCCQEDLCNRSRTPVGSFQTVLISLLVIAIRE
ncbi:hypothetical protein FBUS_05636 [Fasciolopsis buskii]|uniref:Uncharacterized protein n=1 Tax=Fasciolopsis buskii TaxID=27845 RepID=A0A8E0S3K8_9TREM|nr:hypothetical protein FBUS_05636 [Fasciolopsis buski]